ncbi:FIST N-terminal domain-containing protein [Candidatus Halobeggiatoa sp. HSG11]|nr:FIST N-terminal domain-containing protein [Candidatus Halobeggiatoa sp. HSG11]
MSNQNSLQIKRGYSCSLEPAQAVNELYQAIYQPNISLIIFYCSPKYNLEQLATALHESFTGINIIGCTTAGEITPVGYLNGSITGVSLAAEDFTAMTMRIDNLQDFHIEQGQALTHKFLAQFLALDKAKTFAFLLVDGLSMKEEIVSSVLYNALDGISLFGGSAGDGFNFQQTFIYHEGAFHRDCALLTLIQTEYPFTTFKTEHFTGSDKKAVITAVIPEQRLVQEINGTSAALEYADLIGVDVTELNPAIYAKHPLVIKVGGHYYVRSVMFANEDYSLTFASTIDEGLVVSIATVGDLVTDLTQLFDRIRNDMGEPVLVLGCDCLFRYKEIEEKGLFPAINDIMCKNNVIGFSTYGEQFNAMHINQTFTGVAIGKKV